MSNTGKYIDRCPIICAAGKASRPNTSVYETLREYPLVDQIEALKHDLKIFKEKTSYVPEKLPKIENVRHRGTHDRILDHWVHARETRYQQLINDLKETTYHSYWKDHLGRTTDQVPGLPQGIDTLETTFGHKPKDHTSLYEVVFPRTPRYQVLWNSQVNHGNYKKIYNDYNIGEQIDRSYFKPPYNPKNCAGRKSKADVRGSGVACAMKWFKEEPVSIASSRQADYCDRYHLKMGEKYAPIEIPSFIPKDSAFGKRSKREMHGMAELLRPGCEPSIQKRDILGSMASLNMLRQNIKKRFSPTFSLTDLFNRLAYYDTDSTNFIPMEKFNELIACLRINMNHENLEALFTNVGIIQSGKINYRKFVDAIAFDMEFGCQIDPLPKEKLHYCSESTAANFDRYFIDNSNEPAAGLSSYRLDLKIPPRKGCESERDDLQSDDAKALLDRSIFIQYNISYRDMFQQRSKNFLKTLFEKCGYVFGEAAFDALYKMALDRDQTGGVCVDTFYKLLKLNQAPMKKIVDELDCLPKSMLRSCI